jgi:hypothetical protein
MPPRLPTFDRPIHDSNNTQIDRRQSPGRSPLPFYFRRGATPGPFFFTLGLREPRGSVRFGLAACFLRAVRFSFFRSSLSLTFFVFIPFS